MNPPVIIDLQDYRKEGHRFIPKELAAFNGEQIRHYVFIPSVPFDQLSHDVQ